MRGRQPEERLPRARARHQRRHHQPQDPGAARGEPLPRGPDRALLARGPRGRRRLDDDSIGRAVVGAKVNAPAPAYEGAAAEHAVRIIALVAADNPITGRKAA